MAEAFLLPSAVDFEVTVYEGPQLGTGTWRNSKWTEATRDKARSMVRAWHDCDDADMFVWCDADIVFTGPVIGPLRSNMTSLRDDGYPDMLFQQESRPDYVCSGFFCARRNERVLELLERVAKEPYPSGRGPSDQAILNKHKNIVRWDVLPNWQYWTIGHIQKPRRRQVRNQLANGNYGAILPHIPSDIRMYHANFMEGVHRKCAALRAVRDSRWVRKPSISTE